MRPSPETSNGASPQAADLHDTIQRLLPRLHAYVRLRMGPELRRHEASVDLVQSACREALQRADRFTPFREANLEQWLFETALRKLRDRARHWRAERRNAGRPAEAVLSDFDCSRLLTSYGAFASPSEQAVARERLAHIERAFACLEPHQREIILLARVRGLGHADIAARLGKRPEATRMLLSRALARLSSLLEDGGGARVRTDR